MMIFRLLNLIKMVETLTMYKLLFISCDLAYILGIFVYSLHCKKNDFFDDHFLSFFICAQNTVK